MSFEALTLAVFSTLHLTGALRIGAGRSDGAGVAEALICLALLAGVWRLVRSPVRGRAGALAALAFAILGFIVGLSFTLGSGDTIDLAYHLAMLPVLLATAALLARRPVAADL
jgi:multisubunit Na+/H+ antiporter MnhF subunit